MPTLRYEYDPWDILSAVLERELRFVLGLRHAEVRVEHFAAPSKRGGPCSTALVVLIEGPAARGIAEELLGAESKWAPLIAAVQEMERGAMKREWCQVGGKVEVRHKRRIER